MAASCAFGGGSDDSASNDRGAGAINLGEPPTPGTVSYERIVLPPTRDALRLALESGGMQEPRIQDVVDSSQPMLNIVRRDETAPGNTARIHGGRSQVGGYPLLPTNYPWPSNNGSPLSLIAQIDLDALAGYHDFLPSQGLLQIYTMLDDERFWPDQPTVLWFEEADGFVLTRGTASWGSEPIVIDFEQGLSIPMRGRDIFSHWDLADFGSFETALHDPTYIDQLGGYPYELQGDPTPNVALAEAGLTYQDISAVVDTEWPDASPIERWRQVYEEVAESTDLADWRQLLQLEMTPGDGMWFDGGQMSFFIQDWRLANGDFSNVRAEGSGH